MQHLKLGVSLSLLGLLLACAPATRVILLPDGSGKTTAVEVKAAAGTQRLSMPYQTAQVDKNGRIEMSTTDPLVVMDRYGALLAQLLAPEVPFLLYFEMGGAQLTAQSEALLPEILTLAQSRRGGEIIVVAHTDRVGPLDANDALSLQRAKSIRELFVARGFKPELVDAVGRGERSPLVATEDEVEEPKNRRAEVIVR